MDISLLYTLFPNHQLAQDICDNLLNESHVACVNILGPIESHYIWQGQRQKATEVAVILKTTVSKVPVVKDYLLKHHPYEAPAILQILATSLCDNYSDWIGEVTA